MSTISAVSWQVGSVTHSVLYAIGKNDNVKVSVDGGAFTNVGGDAKQISAGLDVFGKPEVYAIGADNAVYVNHAPLGSSIWVSLGGYVTEVSAPAIAPFGASLSLPADLTYVVGQGTGLLHHPL